MRHIFKTLWRFRTSTLINILGLAVALSALYLIFVQVYFDLTYNSSYKECNKLYIACTQSWNDPTKLMTASSRPNIEEALETVPKVEQYGVVKSFSLETPAYYLKNGEKISYDVAIDYWSLSMFDLIGVEMISGDYKSLVPGVSVVISQSLAQKTGLGVGDVLYNCNYNGLNKVNYTIAGIYKDFSSACDFRNISIITNLGDEELTERGMWNYNYYLKFNKGVTAEEGGKAICDAQQEMLKNYYATDTNAVKWASFDEMISKTKITPVPVRGLYFNRNVDSEGLKGNKTTTITLIAIGIILIIVALINYINFFFALVPVRIREVNTKKLFGCPKSKLKLEFVLESALIVMIALLISLYLDFYAANSSLAGYLSTSAAFSKNIPVVIFTIAVAIVLILAGSLYPAHYIVSFNTASIFKGRFANSRSGVLLRSILIGVQFFISFILIACSLFINLQHRYMLNYDLGFDKENIFSVYTDPAAVDKASKRELLSQRLKENPQITDVAFTSNTLVAKERMNWGRDFKGQEIKMDIMPVSYNFLKTMGIDIVDGRDFTPSDELKDGTFIINETAAKKYGINVEDKILASAGEAPVVGICKDFHFKPLQYPITPFAFFIFGEDYAYMHRHIYFKVTPGADIKSIRDHVLSVTPVPVFVGKMRPETMDFKPITEELSGDYTNESHTANFITMCSLISIIISLMGVFGLVMFESQYRKHEIGIRRVLGSSIPEIVKMFNIRYCKIALICFVIAVPCIVYIINEWLKAFAYHIPIYWWVFAIALLIVLPITIVTVSLRCLSAATANPIESLKNE